MTKFRIGRHINTGPGFLTAPADAEELGCQIMQIFLGNPQESVSKAKSDSDLQAFSAELKVHKMKVVIHGHYTINLCHDPSASRFRTSVKALVSDLNSSSVIGNRCLGVIIHMGKNVSEPKISDTQALQNYVRGLQTALAETLRFSNTTIILETGAGVGREVGTKLDALAQIYHALSPEEKLRVRFCIDTCHIWSAGYNIGTVSGAQKFFTEFDDKIGIDRIACIHLNNSKADIGSNVDRHADLSDGYIELNGLEKIVQIARKHSIPIIMETPLDKINPRTNAEITFADELRLVKKWI